MIYAVDSSIHPLNNWGLFKEVKIKNSPYFSDGTGYVDDGREIFDDDLEDGPSTGQLINNISFSYLAGSVM